jgi:hypothetical protein
MDNILFRVPELEGLSPEEFGHPRIGKLARYDGQPSEKDYLVETIEFNDQHTHGLLEVSTANRSRTV